MKQSAKLAEALNNQADAAMNLISMEFGRKAIERGSKYLWLHRALADLIQGGAFRPGTQLPSDDQLASRLGLSVGTVQKAMNALRDDGILERRQGAGTFVVDPSIDMHDVWHFRFLDDGGESFLPVEARATNRTTLSKKGPWSQHMTGVGAFVFVCRKIDVNREFELLSEFYFDGDRFGGLADLPLEAFHRVVLRNILTERFGVTTKKVRQHLACQPLTKRDCRALRLPNDSIGIVLETFGIDQARVPIYYQRVVIPQSNRKLVLDQDE